MEYRIEQYKEEFIEDQYRIAMEVSKDWNFYRPTPPQGLKEAYSRADFDPETRYYCFKNGEMVGFIVSRILGEVDGKVRADLSYPMVLDGHEEVFDVLYKKAIDTLEKKEVKIINMEACDKWGSTLEFVEKSNFKFVENRYVLYDYFTNSYNEEVDIKNAKEYNNDEDFDKLLNYLMNVRGFPEERSRNAINTIVNVYADDVYAHAFYVENNEILARGVATMITNTKVNFYFSDHNDKFDNELFAKLIQIFKQRKVEIVQAYLNKNFQKDEDRYLKLGFRKQGEIKLFEKKL